MRSRNKTRVLTGAGGEDTPCSVGRTVVLIKHLKIGKRLGGKGFKLSREIKLSVESGQQNLYLHQVIPHFRKYLKTERIWRMRPLNVRVFSRAQRCVTTISG